MDELLKSINNFKLTNDKEQFEDDLDIVINKFNEQELNDPNYEWETLCTNYSKLKYLDKITRNYYIPESEKFLLALEKFMISIDNMNKRYVCEIYWDSCNEDGIKETTSISRYNGKNGIGLMLKKQGDANAVDVSKLVREKFKSIEQQNSNAGIEFIIADDSTDNTIAAVNSV